jgi:hypothetical protein
MSMADHLQELDRLTHGKPPFTMRFELVRRGASIECQWRGGAGHEITANYGGSPPGRWSAPDALTVLDSFVEAIEAHERPQPVPPGFEVWRFDRASLRDANAATDAHTNAVHNALLGVLDEGFNAPSLYDARDLRLGAG